MIRRPLRTRVVISPSAKPPTRLPSPMAVSMKAYVARYSSPGDFVISRASTSSTP